MSTGAARGFQARKTADLILSEAARAGVASAGRLPAERELAERLGVSRSAIRQALSLLEAEGAVSRELGRGTFLRGGPALLPGAALDDVAPGDVMTVRCLLEPPAMALVVARATARDFEDIERELASGEAARSFEDFEAADLMLHRRLIAATHNPLLIGLYAIAESARAGQLWGDLKRRADSPGRRAGYRQDHARLLVALQARDGAGAVQAMREHLDSVRANLLAGT